ncbi:MAG: ribbon-helix-helix domain-containing protein [Thermodesulfobacteriota bacterium]
MKPGKQEIITFKADEALLKALEGIPNRSEFIRNAILTALDSVCPLCSGTGVLSVRQREHWEAFTADHALEKCDACHEKMVVCLAGKQGAPHAE